MLYHQSIGTHGGNREECTVNTEGNRDVRGKEGGREGGRESGKVGGRDNRTDCGSEGVVLSVGGMEGMREKGKEGGKDGGRQRKNEGRYTLKHGLRR